MARKVMKYEGGQWVSVTISDGKSDSDTDSDTDSDNNGEGGGVGDMRITRDSKTIPMKRPSGTCREGNDTGRDNQVGRLGMAKKVSKHGINLCGSSKDRKRMLEWSLSEQLRSVRGWMKKVDEADLNMSIADFAEESNVIRKRNDNNADAGQSSLVNLEEAKACKKAFEGCMILLGKMLKHMSSEMYEATILENKMNLDFIKTKLKSNAYKYPSQFAGEMRLKFSCAMTYPPGHIVHDVAKVLLEIFDDRWIAIETEYVRGVKLAHQLQNQETHDQGAQKL